MKYRKEGYLVIDHRASPGITPDQAFAAGQDPYMAVPEGKVLETKTIACAHCGVPRIMNPNRVRPRGHCRKCDRYVCDEYVCATECTPFEKKVDYHSEQRFRCDAGYNQLPMLVDSAGRKIL